jgi:hypothetical protein
MLGKPEQRRAAMQSDQFLPPSRQTARGEAALTLSGGA